MGNLANHAQLSVRYHDMTLISQHLSHLQLSMRIMMPPYFGNGMAQASDKPIFEQRCLVLEVEGVGLVPF